MYQVTRGKVKKPLLILVYGVDKVGKTTFGSQAPDPVFIGPESGSNNLDVARLPTPKNYSDLLAQCEFIATQKFKTVVFDSIDWIEYLMHKELTDRFKTTSIEEVGGGYGKWVSITIQEWKKLIDATSKLRDSGMNIIFISHYHVKSFNDPMTNVPYDRYMLKLNEKASAIFREFVDVMIFATFELSIKENKQGKAKASGDGIRIAYTERRPSHDAGNRFGLPYELAFDYQTVATAIEASTVSDIEVFKKEISDLCADMTDKALLEKINQSLVGADAQKLVVIKNRILQIRGNK